MDFVGYMKKKVVTGLDLLEKEVQLINRMAQVEHLVSENLHLIIFLHFARFCTLQRLEKEKQLSKEKLY